MLSNDDFAALTFADKLSLARALCRSYGLTVWALIMAAGLTLGCLGLAGFSWLGLSAEALVSLSNGSMAMESMAGQLMGVFLLILLFSLLMQVMMIGLNILVLLYIDNQPPASAVPVFLSPWARFGPIFLCLLLWLALSMSLQMALAVLGQIPGLGLVIELGLSVAYSIASNCAMFYIADKILGRNEELPPIEAVLRPLAIVANKPLAWLGAFGFMLALYLPFAAIALLGLTQGGLIVALVGGLGLTAASVFILFLFGVTYRQTLAQYELRSPQLH